MLISSRLTDDRVVPFDPCDPRLPPAKLIELRDSQPDAERGWTKVALTMKPDASFDMKYEYPPQTEARRLSLAQEVEVAAVLGLEHAAPCTDLA